MTEIAPGTPSIVDQAIEEAGQTLFSAADVPLARSDELLAAVSGPAARLVFEMRIEQIVKHGHTAERDDDLDTRVLPSNARSMILAGIDLLNGPNRNLVVARRRFAKSAAMLLAAIDQVDRVLAKSVGEG